MAAQATASAEHARRYLTFRLGETSYAIGILKVQEIIGLLHITPVPGTPQFVRGVINLRGRVIPVVDLCTRFGMPAAPDTDRTCIVITQMAGARGQATMGVVVEDVAQVVDLPPDRVEPVPEFGVDVRTDFLTGVARLEEQVILLLDIDAVLSPDEAELVGDLGVPDGLAPDPAHQEGEE
jgi:purine-binding chemotaxis protein CheW